MPEEPGEFDRLTALQKTARSLLPIIEAAASSPERDRQGLAGIVREYNRAIAEIEGLLALREKKEATVLDQIAAKRAERKTPGRRRA